MGSLLSPEISDITSEQGTVLKAKAVCILGMHRSGTSSASRSINLLGVYLGEDTDLIKPDVDNPEGFWERVDVVALHDRLLSALSMCWDTTLPLPDGWQKLEAVAPLLEELQQLVCKAFAGRPLWGWKDPRTCLLLDAWKELLTNLGMELCIIYVVRHPTDVANSLAKRNGHSMDKAYGIWFNYNLAALKSVLGTRTVFVSYDRLLDEGEAVLRHCATGLEICWPEVDTELCTELASFLRKDLRHSQSSGKDLPRSVAELYELLNAAIECDSVINDKTFINKVDDLYYKYREFAKFMQQDNYNYFIYEQAKNTNKKNKSILNKINNKIDKYFHISKK